MKQLSLENLRTFVTVVELGGFARAGEMLGRSQPAVSLQIKKLEEQLDVKLFKKEGQRQIVNHAGKTLYDMATSLLQQNDKIVQFFTEKPVSGQLRLGIPSEFASRLLPSIIGAFNKMYPDVTLEVTSSLSASLVQKHRAKAFDLLLTLGTEQEVNNDQSYLLDELVWVGKSSQIAPNSPIHLVVAPEGCRYRERLLNALEQAKMKASIRYTIADITGISAAIQAGLGITALARSTVPEELTIIDDPSLPKLGDLAIQLLSDSNQQQEAVAKLEEFMRSRLAINISKTD